MASEKVLETIEHSLDAIEETLDTVERIPKVNLNGTTKKQQMLILAVTAGFSLLGGAAVGAAVSMKRFKTKYEQLAEDEIAEARRYYSVLNKEGKLGDPVTALEELVQEQGYAAPPSSVTTSAGHPALVGPETTNGEDAVEPQQVLDRNVFAGTQPAKDNFDLEAEMLTRTETEPYVLSHDEYFTGEKDYIQTTLTYFVEDDVLIDARDDIIDDPDSTVGEVNLQKFGHGSRDNRIVYVRNDRLEVDFEVIRSEGSYSKDVLGGALKHSNRPGSGRARRMRRDDE
jgi:hypothetical protein